MRLGPTQDDRTPYRLREDPVGLVVVLGGLGLAPLAIVGGIPALAFVVSILGFSVAWSVATLRQGMGGWSIEPARRRCVIYVASAATGIAVVTFFLSAALLVSPAVLLLVAVTCGLSSAFYALSQLSRL